MESVRFKRDGNGDLRASAIMASAGLGTPETYLDTQPRQQDFATKLFTGNRDYPGASSLSLNQFALKGPWDASSESITAEGAGASISGAVQAAKVHLEAGDDEYRGRVGGGWAPSISSSGRF